MQGADPASSVTLGAVLIVSSFAVDRFASAILFVMNYFRIGKDGPARPPTEKQAANQTLLYFFLGSLLAGYVVLTYPVALVMKTLNFDPYYPALDYLVSVAVILGGADRIAALGQPKALPCPSPAQPLEIKGRVFLEKASGE